MPNWFRHGAGLEYLDVGGGLGVDYDGSQTNFESSVNYTLQEYANDVVYHIQSVCDEAGVKHPTIFSESGRAVVAYHSMLIFNVLGVTGLGDNDIPQELPEDAEQPLVDLLEAYRAQYPQRAGGLPRCPAGSGHGDEFVRAATCRWSSGLGRNLFWAICRKTQRLIRQLEYVPEELGILDWLLSETYFCNFSLFQSLPDSWAIKQLFPIMPIHRLDERPTRQAVLGDITCDSDGKLDRFIDRRDVKRTLPVHPLDDRPYYLGAFLVGAYQEILGDMHNLFGDTNAVHVCMAENDEVVVEAVIKGDTVSEVLQYVEFDPRALVRQMRASVEQAIRENRIDDRQAGRLLRFYEAGLEGYTYLEDGRER